MGPLLAKIDVKWTIGIIIALIGLWFTWSQYRDVEPDPALKVLEADRTRIGAILQSIDQLKAIALGQLNITPPNLQSFLVEIDPAFLAAGSLQASIGLSANTSIAVRNAASNINEMRQNLANCAFLDDKATVPLKIARDEYAFVSQLLGNALNARQDGWSAEKLDREQKQALDASGRHAWSIRYTSYIGC